LDDVRAGLAQSVEYFESKNRAEREQWVCREFVHNLNVRARKGSFKSPPDDPPDVLYRGCQFEVKEILDAERRRHDEYKDMLAKALEATDPSALLKMYSPKFITPIQLGSKVVAQVAALSRKYEPRLRQSLDLVFYVNLLETSLEEGPMPAQSDFDRAGWRSVSALMGWGSLVFHARRAAPRLLRKAAGTVSLRKFRQ
jgi:Putative endonuclease, protein of unknown function (DUF1780)